MTNQNLLEIANIFFVIFINIIALNEKINNTLIKCRLFIYLSSMIGFHWFLGSEIVI